jgi:hypothetical protein
VWDAVAGETRAAGACILVIDWAMAASLVLTEFSARFCLLCVAADVSVEFGRSCLGFRAQGSGCPCRAAWPLKGRSRPFIRHGTHLLVLLGIAAVVSGAFAAATGRERHSALD